MKMISQIIMLILISGICMMASGQSGPVSELKDSKVYTIDNCVNQFTFDDTVRTAAGYQYWFVDKMFLDGRTLAGPYSSFYCPPNSLHGIRNSGDTELKYLVIKKYETN